MRVIQAATAPAAAGRQPAGQRPFAAHRPCSRATQAAATPHHKQQQNQQQQQDQQQRGPAAVVEGTAVTAGGRRRQLLVAAGLLAASRTLVLPSLAVAEEEASGSSNSGSRSRQVYFDMSVDRKSLGRIIIEVPADAPAIGGQRFLDLSQGKEGVHFRKTRFELIDPAGFIQNSGMKELSYQASGRTAITGGLDTELLEDELAAQAGRGGSAHSGAGLVSLLVQPRIEIREKDKLMASKGKLITVTETFGVIPNGSQWSITTRAAPQLDESSLVVGRVVQGMDVVAAMAALPRVKDNTYSPFFQAGKIAGDKRANVAERAFNKPFSKIVVDECGFL